MSSNNLYKSDLTGIYNIIQSSMIVYPKEVIIATLRDFFSKDSYYSYQRDKFGFANTTDHTDLPLGADMPYGPGSNPQLNNDPVLPTRLFIGENYRYDVVFYPAVLVKSGGSKYVQVSFNRDEGKIQYDKIIFTDGYGHETTIARPVAFITSGAWEGSIVIDVLTRSLRSRDDLVELIAMCFTDIHFETLHQIGVIVKPISISSPSETEDRNDKLFKQTLTLDIRTEWERRVPITNTVDAILFAASFSDLKNKTPVAANLTINDDVNIIDTILRIK